MLLKLLKDMIIPMIITSVIIFGVIWNFAGALGLEAGLTLFLIMIFLSIIISLFYSLIKNLVNVNIENEILKEENLKLIEDTKNLTEKVSYCCVINQTRDVCPIGITSIIPEMKETITSSLLEANRSFKWLGLSSFNVLHNNKEIFYRKKDVQFEFVVANPNNGNLTTAVDKFYGDVKGRMGAKKLVSESNALMTDMKEINSHLEVIHHNQMPSFRVLLIDDKKAYVSFYERGIDALESVQIKIEDNELAEYSIYKWFLYFYEKFLINESLLKHSNYNE